MELKKKNEVEKKSKKEDFKEDNLVLNNLGNFQINKKKKLTKLNSWWQK